MTEARGHGLLRLQQLEQATVPFRFVGRPVFEADVLERDRLGMVRTLGKVDDRRGAATDLAQDAILANGFWNSAHEGSGGLHGICAGHC